MTFPLITRRPPTTHLGIIGASGYGKSKLLALLALAWIRSRMVGLSAVDPHGTFVREIVDVCANPAHGLHDRDVHYFNPAGGFTLGLNPLQIDGDVSDERAAECANVVTRVIEAKFGASPEQTPRLARLVFVLSFAVALRRGTLLDVLKLLTLGGAELREVILGQIGNPVIRDDLADLDALARTQPARFLEVTESLRNRLTRWVADPRMARMLGQPQGLNPQRLMDQRAIALFDLGALDYADASFIGCLIGSLFFSHARRRPPDRSAPHVLALDEAESLLTIDTARALDQTRKHGLFVYGSIQRWEQARRTDEVADALITNCGAWCAFRVPNPEHARFFAELFALSPSLRLNEYKPGTERPVAVGSRKVLVESRGLGESRGTSESRGSAHTETIGHARSTSVALGRSHSQGRAESTSASDGTNWSNGQSSSRSIGSSEGQAHGLSRGHSHGTSAGSTVSHSHGASASSGMGESASLSLAPPHVDLTASPPSLHSPNLRAWYASAPEITAMTIGTSLSSSHGTSASHGLADTTMSSASESNASSTSHSASQSRSSGTTESQTRGGSQSTSRGETVSEAWGTSESVGYGTSESIAHGRAESVAYGTSRAVSVSEGLSETYITDYTWMPSALFTLEEQIGRVQAELQSLQPREVIVRLHGDAPLRLRTPDMAPGFKSDRYRDLLVPRYIAAIAARNPYLVSVDKADALVAERLARTEPAPDRPDDPAAPETFAPVDDPTAFAREFWRTRAKPKPRPKPGSRSALRIVKSDGDNTE